MAILICGYMMSYLPGDTWLRLLIWLGLGLAIYFGYGKNNSRVARAEAGR
jgi:APA family basic amino acid/polyamine antiporter